MALNPVGTFTLLLLGFIAAASAVGDQQRIRTVNKDGKEYVIARRPSKSTRGPPVDPCRKFKRGECDEQDGCSHIELGNRFICLRDERVELLHSMLASAWLSPPTKAVCDAARDEDECLTTAGCEVFESPTSKLCAPSASEQEVVEGEEKPFKSQDIDDFEVTLAENDASIAVEAGVELLFTVDDDDVGKAKVARFRGWELDSDAQIYQFLGGNANGGQSNSAGVGLSVSRDEIEFGPEFKREYGNDVELNIPAIRYTTRNG